MGRKGAFDNHQVHALEQILADGIPELRTENIGVSADQSSDLQVDTGTETRLALDDTSPPFFDDFGELDENANEIVLEHGSHHELTAHSFLEQSGAAGTMWLRIYVNDVQRALGKVSIKNNEDAVDTVSVPLKLDLGDVVHATVEHNTGSTETFPGANGGNYVSSIRQ